MKSMRSILIVGLLLAGCATNAPTNLPTATADPAVNAANVATNTANATKNAHNTAINDVLSDAKGVLGSTIVNGLISAITTEAAGGKVDWQQSLSAGLNVNVSASTVDAFKQIADDWSGGKTPKTVDAALTAFSAFVDNNPGITTVPANAAIANVISAVTAKVSGKTTVRAWEVRTLYVSLKS